MKAGELKGSMAKCRRTRKGKCYVMSRLATPGKDEDFLEVYHMGRLVNEVCISRSTGNIWVFDNQGNLICRKHPDGMVERWKYDAQGGIASHSSSFPRKK